MTSALAAFFGCPLGGSLFALEVCSRFGLEYYEHALEAILASEVCLAVFRYTSGLPIAPIWDITETKLASSNALHIVYGVGLGLVGAAIAFAFARIHKNVVMRQFRVWNLLDNDNAIPRAWLGASVILCVGMIIPHTLFWGEYEFQTIATMSPASTLPHAFPAKSIVGFEMHNFTTCLLVGLAKLVCISFTVAGGYRGGYIFPLFSAAAAFGRAIYFVIPVCPVQLCVLCMAAALNVAITRTALGSTLILAYLAGEPSAMAAILAASLTSLFATAYMPPFIATQIPRADLEHSLHTSTAMYQLSLSLGGAAAASLSNTGGHGKHDFLEDSDDSLSGKTEALTPFLEDHKHQIGDNHYADCSSALLV